MESTLPSRTRSAFPCALSAALAAGLLSAAPASAASTTTSYFIDSGASSSSTLDGRTWSADSRHTGSSRVITGTSVDPSGSEKTLANLYLTQRVQATGYDLPLADGTYDVKVHYLEPYWKASGKRLFHVDLEGKRVDANLDVFKLAGGKDKALVRTYRVQVSDGTLNLDFVKVLDNTVVAAVEVAKTTARTDAKAYTTNADLAFDLPTPAQLRNGKYVFAHFMPSLPVSIDNEDPATDYWARNYNKPSGEGGAYSGIGGFARDRPLPVQPGNASSWRLDNLKHEIRQARSAGIDGFALDILSVPTGRNWPIQEQMLEAAAQVDPGFKVLLMPDMKSLAGRTQAEIADVVNRLDKPSAHRIGGKLVVAPFHAETHDIAWWNGFVSLMKTKYGTDVALFPTFLDERPYTSSFRPISVGTGNWGVRNPLWNDPTLSTSTTATQVGRVRAAKAAGYTWMHPVSLQDNRPNKALYDEAGNTENLKNTWRIAREQGADWVQLTTWNDYTETTQVGPSTNAGWSALDLNAYYLTWFKTGTAPTVTKDVLYLSHRTQFKDAKPSHPQTSLMSLRGGTAGRDTVEVTAFLTKAATVEVKVGSSTQTCQLAAGVSSCLVPLRTGSVSASIKGSAVTVTSPYVVTATPVVQDLAYHMASSRRNP
jgi:hypothetical protein